MEHYKDVITILKEVGTKGLTFKELVDKAQLDREVVYEVIGRAFKLQAITQYDLNGKTILRARLTPEELYQKPYRQVSYKNQRRFTSKEY